MGWKTLKDRFGILGRILVSEADAEISIFPDAGPVIVVNVITGAVFKQRSFSRTPALEDVLSLPDFGSLASASPEAILDAINAKDVFKQTLPIYAFSDKGISQYFCENPEPGNTTHCGVLIDTFRFFPTKDEAVLALIKNKEAVNEMRRREILKKESQVSSLKSVVEKEEQEIADLNKLIGEVN